MNIVPIFLKLPPENIVNLKFVIESYEELGIVRTLDAQSAKVVILALTDTVKYINELIDQLAPELRLMRIAEPEALEGDWLLSESS
jgi:hypothetical protein